MNWKKFGKGLLIGGSLGGGLGLLLSPNNSHPHLNGLIREVDETASLVKQIAANVSKLDRSVLQLKSAIDQFGKPFPKEIQKSIAAFQFQAEPRLVEIRKTADKVAQEAQDL
ncbi:MAG: hypothetical protein LKJ03_07120 [Enterococcaceae bacterium]|jgi:gas vesicle protein|nr:hypothetical protein [Enterococcaceae bacterium]MCI1919838.1 hypothetical protein [Enterococcaceae bacterium]